jgi:hypothetical protein
VNSSLKRAAAAVACGLLAPALAGCAKAVSTSAFKGEQHEVAKAISDLQSDVTANDEKKVCANDLARAIVARLDAAPGGCRKAIKDQLAEIDNDELAVDSVQIAPAGSPRGATARVRSIFSGKTVRSTLTLVKEGNRWKVSGLG